ncbi:hypothetical protein [Hymenobacter negativus]|uniref:Uncharacterized protein n=1 Tax=Hymenobacter negativus TaxID=2795026 RepID=A0ABS3QIZ1_9BACT|nr:hypothetical protein [Hymenobacter negativus]MBO2011202.1 hypothetical protein [Hymenobacter negativus]
MGYTIRALVGSATDLLPFTSAYPQAVCVALGSGLSLIPLTDDLFDTLMPGEPSEDFAPFYFLTPQLEARLLHYIGKACIGYLEAEYFGGVGEQAAVLWNEGHREMVRGPQYGAINAVLARLGIQPASSDHDEFDTAGFGQRRHTEDWLLG